MNPLTLIAAKALGIFAILGGLYWFATDWANDRCDKRMLEENEKLRLEIANQQQVIGNIARSYEAEKLSKESQARKHIKELNDAILRNPGWSDTAIPDDIRVQLGNKAR